MDKAMTWQIEELLSIALDSDCDSCRELALKIKPIMGRKVEFSPETMELLQSSFLHHSVVRS